MSTYYVDPRVSGADDASDGLSRNEPWLTLNKINLKMLASEFLPGDTFIIADDCVYTDPLVLLVNGTSLAPITAQRSNDGTNRPEIRAHTVLSSSGWTLESGSIYKKTGVPEPANGDDFPNGAVFEDTTRLTGAASLVGVDEAGKFFWEAADDGTLYVWASDSSNPITSGKTYRVCQPNTVDSTTNLGIDCRADWIIVDGFDVYFNAHYNIGQQYQNGRLNRNVRIKNCKGWYSYHDNIAYAPDNTDIYDGVNPAFLNLDAGHAADFGIACLDANTNHAKKLHTAVFTVRNAGQIGVTPEGTVDSCLWESFELIDCFKGIAPVSDIGDVSERKPTNQTFRNGTISGGTAAIVINADGNAWGLGNLLHDIEISGSQYGVYDDRTDGVVGVDGAVRLARIGIFDCPAQGVYLARGSRGPHFSYITIARSGTDALAAGFRVTGDAEGSILEHATMHECGFGYAHDSTGGNHELYNNVANASVNQDLYYNNGSLLSGSNNHWRTYGGAAAGGPDLGDPLFRDADGDDFTPLEGSPLLDAGLAIVGVNDGTWGVTRNSIPDIGSVEGGSSTARRSYWRRRRVYNHWRKD